jgi:hypothetical protein
VSLENVARDLARDGDPARMTRFVDVVLAPKGLPSWTECRSHVYWCIESAAQDFETTILERISDKVVRVAVATDEGESALEWLTAEQLGQWKVTRDEVERAAFGNLDALLARSRPPEVQEMHGAKLGMLPIESVFKSSVIFAPGFRAYVQPAIGWPILAIIPDRDFIYVIAERDRGLLDYMGQVVQREYRSAAYPISTEVLRVSDRGIEALGAFPE